jgi:uncharacterized protein (TIGR02118 family)
VEHLLIAVWTAPGREARPLLDTWAPTALEDDNVETCTISFADPDQGEFPGPPCAVLIALGLTRAHDIDDVPARDALYAIAREVHVWRVDPRRPIVAPPGEVDGDDAIKRVSFVHRLDGLTHEQFVRHWTEVHTSLAQTHHVGLADYTQNVVRRAYTPGGATIDGIAELRFRTRRDLEERFYDSDAGRLAIRADVAQFIGRGGLATTLMREVRLRTASRTGPALP